MTMQASGTFEVKLNPLPAHAATADAKLGRMWLARKPYERIDFAEYSIVAQTEEAIAAVLGRHALVSAGDAATTAHVVTAIMFLSMAASVNGALSIDEIVQDIRTQVGVLLSR